jgi:hypothetical protein
VVAIGYVAPTPNDPTKVLKAGDTMTGDLLLSGSGTDLTVEGATTVSYQGVTVNVGEALSALMSTGIVSGGFMSVNVGNPAAVDFSATVAYIVNPSTGSTSPALTRVSIPAQTVPLSGGSLTRLVTWWVLEPNGTITQQAARPTGADLRTRAVLGTTGYDIGSGVIFVCKPIPTLSSQLAAQVADLWDALGPFSITGNTISPNGVNLMINQSAGTMFARSFDYDIDPLNPHNHATFGQTPAQFQYSLRGVDTFQGLTNTIDPSHYDLNGVKTLVGGGASSSTIQRVYLFATETASAQLAIQYGQTVHSSLTNAVNAIGSGTFVPNPNFIITGALLGFICLTRTATNLSDTTQAVFIKAGKFDTP